MFIRSVCISFRSLSLIPRTLSAVSKRSIFMSNRQEPKVHKQDPADTIVHIGDPVRSVPSSTAATDESEHGTKKLKRKAERAEEELELRRKLDPDHTMNRKEWNHALCKYRITQLPDDQLIEKLKNVKFSEFAAEILQSRGVDLSKFDIAPPKPKHVQKPQPAPAAEDDNIPDSSYYYLDGYRLVWPYPSIYKARAKLRWRGRKMREVLKEEFVAFHDGYIDHAIANNRFLINGERANPDHVFRGHDVFNHIVHRHEPPVKDEPVDVVAHRPDLGLIVVNKPSSIPVHPCGKFCLNSVTHILAKETEWKHVHVVHRLDRATSGLLIMATDPQAAMRISEQLRTRSLRKHYLARVRGRFPRTMAEAEALGARVRQQHGRNGIGSICTDLSTNSTVSADAAFIPPLLGDWADNSTDATLLWDGVGSRSIDNANKHHDCASLADGEPIDETVLLRRTEMEPSAEDKDLCELVVDRPVASTDIRYGLFGVGPAESPSPGPDAISSSSSSSADSASTSTDWDKYNSQRYGPEGKAALTAFRFVSYDPLTDTSLVHCMPRTGRTHQLRVHLMHLGFPIANDERYGGLRVPDWRHVRRACFDKAGLEPDADCAELDVDNRHKNVDDAETRRELWLKAKDKSCMHCIDVTAGIWADRFHFLKPAATEPKAESESIDNNTTHTMSDDAQPQPQSQPQPQQRQVIPMGETTTGETAASAVSSGAAQGLTGVSFKEQCCNSGNASTAEVEWDGNVPVRDGEVAMDVFPDNIDINPEREVIWLHALKYEAPNWTFNVPAPAWAADKDLVIPNMYYVPK